MNRLLPALVALAATVLADPGRTHALLVGCSEYPNLRERGDYEDWIRLYGPTNDVELLRATFEEMLGVSSDSIEVLAGWPAEEYRRPTRSNILAHLDRLVRESRKGDRVIVYLAGHGSQQPDESGDERDGWDEIFLPADVKSWNRSKREVENAISDDVLGAKFEAIRDRGALVWALFDCCHAGSAVRGAASAERVRRLDPAVLAIPSSEQMRRGFEASPLSEMRGVVAMYAAQSHRLAPELELPRHAEHREWHGLFSFTLASQLRLTGARCTFRELCARMVAAYQAVPWHSTVPTAEGELDLHVSGEGRAGRPPLWIRSTDEGVMLNAGRLVGIEPGSRLAIRDPRDRIVGHADVVECGMTRALCEGFPVPEGEMFRAEVVAVPVGECRLGVFQEDGGERPLDDTLFLRADEPGKADWILDASATRLRPACSGDLFEIRVEAGKLAETLRRVYRYHNLKRYAAGGKLGHLPEDLVVRMERRGPEEWEPITAGGVLHPGDSARFLLRNDDSEAHDVTILILQADLRIFELFPHKEKARIEPGDSAEVRFGITDDPLGTEHALVLAVPREDAQDEVWFGWLSQDSLSITRGTPRHASRSALEMLAFGGTTRGGRIETDAISARLFTWRTEWGPDGPPDR